MKHMEYFNLEIPPPFGNIPLLPWQDLNFDEIRQYAVEEQRHGSASVNVFRVVGTKHPDYAGGTWLDLLRNGKRMQINLPLLRSNPGYYLETGPKSPYMHYVSIDGGDIYIGDEGNHRTCIARFYFFTQGLTVLHGIVLQDYRIDWAFKSLCDELNNFALKSRFPIYLSIERKLVERQDAADWRLDKFALTAKVVDSKNHETYRFDTEGLSRYLEQLKKPWWKIWAVAH